MREANYYNILPQEIANLKNKIKFIWSNGDCVLCKNQMS